MPSDFHFLQPLWFLALPPLGLLLWSLSRGATDSAWRRVIDPRLLAVLLVDNGTRTRRLPLVLLATGWLIAVIALANPTLERLPVPAFRSDAARVLVLDLSASMLAADLTPTRLARARYKVADILARGADGQAGLVVFAGDAFAVTPLTDDAETILAQLEALTPDLMPVQGSRADLGLRKALDLLTQAGARNGEVVLITDEANDDRAIAAARELRAGGHRLAVIGVGTAAGAAVPGVRRSDGPVIASLDEPALRRLASAADGRYAPLSANSLDLDAVLTDPVRPAALADDDPRLAEVWQGLGPWLVLILLPLGALAFRRGWLAGLVLLAAQIGTFTPQPALALGWDDLWQRRDQQAAQALAAGEHERARALAADPAQLGSAQYRLGDYAAAARAFAGGAAADDHYNRGNALARGGDLAAAITAYDQALALDPGHADARHNRAQVEQALKGQERQQPQDGDQGDQGDKGDHGDQGKQGDQADQGKQGDQGDQADQGKQGDQGDQADQGDEGKEGDQGDQADQGEQGDESDQRQAADQGQQGGQGDQREPGPDQPAGANADPTAAEQAASAYRDEAAQADGDQQEAKAEAEAEGKAGGAEPLSPAEREARQAAEQWLRRIPDDPAGLLRRKFLYQYQTRDAAEADLATGNPW